MRPEWVEYSRRFLALHLIHQRHEQTVDFNGPMSRWALAAVEFAVFLREKPDANAFRLINSTACEAVGDQLGGVDFFVDESFSEHLFCRRAL